MRYHQRPQAVVGHNAAGIADNVRVSGLQSQGANRKPGIHAGEDGKLARRARSQCAQFVGAGVDFIGFQDFINHAHVCHSVTKQLPVASLPNCVKARIYEPGLSEAKSHSECDGLSALEDHNWQPATGYYSISSAACASRAMGSWGTRLATSASA